jgi:hypothetical protein
MGIWTVLSIAWFITGWITLVMSYRRSRAHRTVEIEMQRAAVMQEYAKLRQRFRDCYDMEVRCQFKSDSDAEHQFSLADHILLEHFARRARDLSPDEWTASIEMQNALTAYADFSNSRQTKDTLLCPERENAASSEEHVDDLGANVNGGWSHPRPDPIDKILKEEYDRD